MLLEFAPERAFPTWNMYYSHVEAPALARLAASPPQSR